jgi:hypothetical protein
MTENRFVGTWTLVSAEMLTPSGASMPLYGADGKGIIMYDAQGHMAVQLMQQGRPLFTQPDRLFGAADEMKAAFEGYSAYFGRYEVNVTRGVVIHHVEGCLFPNWIGSDQQRSYTFMGDRLVLKTPPMQLGGVTGVNTLVWERVG